MNMSDFKDIILEHGLSLQEYEDCIEELNKCSKGISELDWSDIKEKYNLPFHPDTLRKAQQTIFGGRFVSDYYKLKGSYDTNMYSEDKMDEKIRELDKARHKYQATKLEFDRVNRVNDRFELFYENIKDSIEKLPSPEFKDFEINLNQGKEYVLTISDIHFGAKFKSANNEYSMKICEDKFSILLSYLIKKIEKNNINNITILGLGDTIQGILRLKDISINEKSVVDATTMICKIISKFLNELSKYCYIRYYHCTSSNHSQTRPLASKPGELASEDLERLMANYISDVLELNERIDVIFDTDKDYLKVHIYDFEVIMMHGHQIKNIDNSIKDLSMLHRKMYDYIFLGHRHSYKEVTVGEGEFHNIKVISCPSFIGSDPFSDSLFVGSKPSATLHTFDEKYGHVGSKDIILV